MQVLPHPHLIPKCSPFFSEPDVSQGVVLLLSSAFLPISRPLPLQPSPVSRFHLLPQAVGSQDQHRPMSSNFQKIPVGWSLVPSSHGTLQTGLPEALLLPDRPGCRRAFRPRQVTLGALPRRRGRVPRPSPHSGAQALLLQSSDSASL